MKDSCVLTRVLAIDPCPVGLGFVVLEEENFLIDWGLKVTERGDKSEFSLSSLERLIQLYQPDVLVVENCRERTSRRRPRVRELIESAIALAAQHKVRTRRIPMVQIKREFEKSGVSKYEIAVEVAKRLPLLGRLPRQRSRPWISEDPRMSIFAAAARALVYISSKK